MENKQVGPEFVASVLADVYETHYNAQENGVTEKGRAIIIDIYSQIIPADRGEVYVEFLKELDARGITYDVSQFQETVH